VYSETARDAIINRLPCCFFPFGVNDIVIENGAQRVPLQESLDNARLMPQKAQTQYTVLWVGPPPIVDAAHNERTHVLSETFSHLANELNVPYIPVLPALVANEEYKQEVKENERDQPSHHQLCGGLNSGAMTALAFVVIARRRSLAGL